MAAPPFLMLPSPELVLRADRVGKVYHVVPRLRPLLTGRLPSGEESDRVTALSDVSLDVAKGEAVALIGANGAGKSTFLRILAGLSRPTRGSVSRHARLGTLLDLGAGLVDEWTGENNARSALSLQGASLDRLSEVQRFADIGEFFSQPVRTYSTGMRLRLAYALAMGLEPDILVADEIVAVGDEGFQRRCALEMQRFLDDGGTLVLATHNLYLAQKLCQKALWLEAGRVRAAGATHDVTQAYRDGVARKRSSHAVITEDGTLSRNDRVSGVKVTVRAADGAASYGVISTGAPWRIELVGFHAQRPARVDVRRIDGTLVLRFDTSGESQLDFRACPLLPGRFVLEVWQAGDGVLGRSASSREEFVVRGARRELGSVVLEHEWT